MLPDCPYCGCAKLYRTKRYGRFRCAGCGRDVRANANSPEAYGKKPPEWYAQIRKLKAAGMNARQIVNDIGGDYKWIWAYLKKLAADHRGTHDAKDRAA